MDETNSVVEAVYVKIKREVCSGAILPGERIDVKGLCDRHQVSKSPIRAALYRLVGEGLLEVKAHYGFYRPRLTPESAADLINWLEDMLLMSLKMAEDHNRLPETPPVVTLDDNDVTENLETVFEAIAGLSGNTVVITEVRKMNDRMRAMRRTQPAGLIDRPQEIKAFVTALAAGEYVDVRHLVKHHTQQRIAVLSDLVVSAYSKPSIE